jgi:hypothetical protein
VNNKVMSVEYIDAVSNGDDDELDFPTDKELGNDDHSLHSSSDEDIVRTPPDYNLLQRDQERKYS